MSDEEPLEHAAIVPRVDLVHAQLLDGEHAEVERCHDEKPHDYVHGHVVGDVERALEREVGVLVVLEVGIDEPLLVVVGDEDGRRGRLVDEVGHRLGQQVRLRVDVQAGAASPHAAEVDRSDVAMQTQCDYTDQGDAQTERNDRRDQEVEVGVDPVTRLRKLEGLVIQTVEFVELHLRFHGV